MVLRVHLVITRVHSIVERIKPFWFFQLSGWAASALLLLSTIPFASDHVLIAYRNRELRLRLTSGADLKVSHTYRDPLDRWLSGK
jgi:hypothetical protein